LLFSHSPASRHFVVLAAAAAAAAAATTITHIERRYRERQLRTLAIVNTHTLGCLLSLAFLSQLSLLLLLMRARARHGVNKRLLAETFRVHLWQMMVLAFASDNIVYISTVFLVKAHCAVYSTFQVVARLLRSYQLM
jgi:hypothetical protein